MKKLYCSEKTYEQWRFYCGQQNFQSNVPTFVFRYSKYDRPENFEAQRQSKTLYTLSQPLKFEPSNITAGNYNFAIGIAGSCTLVLQAILPVLLVADGPSEVILEGGTHNPYAPPFDFLDQAFLGLINKMGPTVSASLIRPSFYPAGGGTFITQPPSRHTMTNVEEVKQFLDLNINCTEIDDRRWQISIEK
jgi:hypothetical protein